MQKHATVNSRSLPVACWVAMLVASCDAPFAADYARFRAIQPGMTEANVKEALGEPNHIYYRDTAPSTYYVEGYSYEKREIGNKVFIYIGTEPIAYVYFDRADEVEHVFVGGS